MVPEKLDANGRIVQPAKEVTVAKPASELKNAITRTDKSGKQVSGVPVETMQQKADARNQNKPATVPKPKATAPATTITPSEFDAQWAALKPGQTLVGPDGKTYTKK